MKHSREDIETVCGALQTLDPLTATSKDLWMRILDHTLNREVPLTLEAAYCVENPGGNFSSAKTTFADAFRKRVTALNEGLSDLFGYGLGVKVESHGDNYFLTIKRDQNNPSTYLDGLLLHDFQCPAIWESPLNVWVPVHNKGADVAINLRTVDRVWTPPGDYVGYNTYRDKIWEQYVVKHNKSRKSRGWCVESFLPYSGHPTSIELTLCPVQFADIVATTLHLEGKLPAETYLPNGVKTIKEWLKKHSGNHSRIVRLSGLTHFLPAANPLTVEVNLVTNDNHFIVRRYDKEKSPSKSRLEPAIFGYVDSLMDVYRNSICVPDPSETAFRISCQLLCQAIRPARISWLGVGLGLNFGNVSLFGEVILNQSANQIIEAGLGNLEAVKANVSAIRNLGNSNPNMREHCKVLLALSLAKLDKSVDILTSTRPSDKLNAQLPRKKENRK